MKIAVIGAGFIGQAWAIVFARAGHQVSLWDGLPGVPAQALDLLAELVGSLQEKGLIENAAAVLAAIEPTENLAQALEGAAYVQENLPEQIALKQDIFAKMDALADAQTVLASSTSGIPASQFTEKLPGRARCLVAHPVNPPYLIPVVELCASPWTNPQSLEKARQIMIDSEQKPVIVHAEPKGFILNRLQGAVLREAFRLVQAGHISVEDLDTTMKDGLGLRWSFMGPLETIDLNAPDGVRDYCERYGEMYRSISEEQTSVDAWPDGLIAEIERQRRSLLPEEGLQARRLWRDDRLMSLLLHKKAQRNTQ